MAAPPRPPVDPDLLPPAPPGWELDASADPAQECEDEESLALVVPPLPRLVLRLFRPFRRATPSARDQWVAYYQSRAYSRVPDVALFARLLAYNGCWDLPSPFVPGSRQATQFCQDGVFLADIVFLLDRWVSHVMEQGFGMFEVGSFDTLSGDDATNPYLHDGGTSGDVAFPLAQDSFSSIHRHIAMQSRADAHHQCASARGAARCMIMLFLDRPAQWRWIDGKLHAENRLLLCKILYDAALPSERPRLIRAWVAQQWLSAAAASRLAAGATKAAIA